MYIKRRVYLVDVYETFVGLVDKYDIDPVNLKIEITETALMSDFDKNMGIVKRLQNYGFNIEIDDFGSGYSSLNMLKDISADVLKIDMGFLRASENEAKGLDILESIITLAGKLGMKVITEGVETKKQLYMLAEMGCDMYQGYYFSKPIPVDEFEKNKMCVEMKGYIVTGTIKKNWRMLITVLAAVIGVLAVYQPENAVCYAADNDTSAIEIRTSKDLLEASGE